MIFKNFAILLYFIVDLANQQLIKNANNYGHYILKFDDYKDCKGPKAKNLTAMTTDMDAQRLIGFVNLTFMDDTKIDEIKVQVHNLRDNKKNFLWSYKLNEPCKHFAVAAMIKLQLNTDNNCVVKKGNYTSRVNFGDVIHSFLGDTFFYGTYIYRANMLSKKGNVACFISIMTFSKQT